MICTSTATTYTVHFTDDIVPANFNTCLIVDDDGIDIFQCRELIPAWMTDDEFTAIDANVTRFVRILREVLQSDYRETLPSDADWFQSCVNHATDIFRAETAGEDSARNMPE